MKQCPRCGENKSVEEFGWRNKAHTQRHSWCASCISQYQKKHYQANRDGYIQKAAESTTRLRARNTQRLWEYLLEHPCVDCGEKDPVVLEFDHRDQATKVATVSKLVLGGSWDRVVLEIEKCDVRCANCHRRKTATQLGWSKASH